MNEIPPPHYSINAQWINVLSIIMNSTIISDFTFMLHIPFPYRIYILHYRKQWNTTWLKWCWKTVLLIMSTFEPEKARSTLYKKMINWSIFSCTVINIKKVKQIENNIGFADITYKKSWYRSTDITWYQWSPKVLAIFSMLCEMNRTHL